MVSKSKTLYRFGASDIEVSRSAGDGRTIRGLAVPFDEPAQVDDGFGPFTEVFRRGAFRKTINDGRVSRIKLHTEHDRGQRLPIGRATLLREDKAGLYAEFRVSETERGDEALTLVRDGTLDAMSIGFRPIRDLPSSDRSTVERLEVRLTEVSVVSIPAYDGARIAGVRSGLPYLSHADAAARLADMLKD